MNERGQVMNSEERFEAAAAGMDELKAKIEEVNKAVRDSFTEGAANFRSDMQFTKSSIEGISDETEEKIEAKKDARLEKRRTKLQELQDKINDLGQAYAKADQEDLIVGLIEYADECRDTAVYMADEAVNAYRAAAKELAKYNEKYGDQ